jgi:2-aminoadipate transaminase
MSFDYTPFLRADLPAPAARFGGFPKYNFVGGHNDAGSVPVADLAAAASAVLTREGPTLATYGLNSGPQGYTALRQGIARHLGSKAGLACSADDILVTSGSLQALDLINAVFIQPGDTAIVEEGCYGGAMTRLKKLGASYVGAPLDGDGIRMDALANILDDLKAKGTVPKFVYTIPTVQNPTGSVMPVERRVELLRLAASHGIPIVEDDCYADLIWDGDRPTAIKGLPGGDRVVYCGSFSKSIAPALRVGYIVADWPVLSRMLPLKTDGGTGALEQMVLAEYLAGSFDDHVAALRSTLKGKCAAMMEAVNREFGAAAEFSAPKGGIFLWVTLPDAVDTMQLFKAAGAEGVAINPGGEWSADAAAGSHKLRLCFANPSVEEIREGVAKLAEICHREFGVPVRSGNVGRSG